VYSPVLVCAYKSDTQVHFLVHFAPMAAHNIKQIGGDVGVVRAGYIVVGSHEYDNGRYTFGFFGELLEAFYDVAEEFIWDDFVDVVLVCYAVHEYLL
jgi:hypothetical protein